MTEETNPAAPAEEPVFAQTAKEPSRVNRAFAGVGVAVGLIIWATVFPLPLAIPGWVVMKSHPRIGMFLGFLGLLLVVPGMLWKAKSVWGADWRKALPLARVSGGLLLWTLLNVLAYLALLVGLLLAVMVRGGPRALPNLPDPTTSVGVLGVVIGAPMAEEVLFRGYGLMRIRELGGDRRALLLTALVFALIHGSWLKLPITFIVGLFLGWLVLRTGSLWPALLAHLVNNGTLSLLGLLGGSQSAGASDLSNLSWTLALALVVPGALALAVLWWPQIRGRVKELAPRPGGGNPETMESQS